MSTQTFTEAQTSQYQSILKIVEGHKKADKKSAIFILRPTNDAQVNALRQGVRERLINEGFTISEPAMCDEGIWEVRTITWA